MDMKHLDYIHRIAATDVAHLMEREKTYRGSWKKRGGIGAFMMLARKWDRIENFMENKFAYDIFDGIYADRSGADGTVLAEVRDLRQYLLLIESEMVARGVVAIVGTEQIGELFSTHGTPEDGGHHARQSQG